MKVKEIMTKELFTLCFDHKLNLAKEMMSWQRIRHIPVVNHETELVGLITHRDLLGVAVSELAGISEQDQKELYASISVGEVMKQDVLTVAPEADLREAAALMVEHKIGCLPVVEEKKLVGVVTEADFLTLAWEGLGREKN